MPGVGQIEKKTQERVLALLSQRLGYTWIRLQGCQPTPVAWLVW